MKKNILFISLCSLLFMDMTTFSFLIPIFPDKMIAKGTQISIVGLILSFYPISYFIISIYLGKTLFKYDKRKVIIISQLFLVFANFIFVFVDMFDNNLICIFISIMARLIQGLAIGGASSVIYSYIPDLYPESMDEHFGIIETAVGGGVALGPVLGGYIYEYSSYELSFSIIGGIYALFSIFFCFMINNKLYSDLNFEEIDNSLINHENSPLKKNHHEDLSFIDILKNRDFIFTLLVHCISYTSYTLIQPSFSEHIKIKFGGNSDTVGLIFAMSDASYALTALFLLRLFKGFRRKNLFIFGGLVTFISLLMIGPEEYTFLPQNLIVVCIGMILLGFSQVFYTAPIIPEFMEILKEIFGQKENITEMGSGLFNAALAISEFSGPLSGGILTEFCGFERGLTYYSLFLLAYLIFYGLVIKRRIRKKSAAKSLEGSKKRIESEKNIEIEQIRQRLSTKEIEQYLLEKN